MANIVATGNAGVGLLLQPGVVKQPADRYYFRPPVAGTYTFDGVVSDVASEGAFLAAPWGAQALDPTLYPSELREATVSYGGGEYYFRYYYYLAFPDDGAYTRNVVGASLLDSQMAPILDITAFNFVIDTATLRVTNFEGQVLGTLGDMDLWQMLFASEYYNYVQGTQEVDVINAAAATSGVELHGMGGDDTLTGGAGNDYIDGGEGLDTLIGGAGNDFIKGGEGNDRLDGGAGVRDTVKLKPAPDGVRVTLDGANWVTVFVNGQATDVIRNFEDVIGGEGNDTLVGDTLGNWLDGYTGDDRLLGGGGDDILEDDWDEDLPNGGGRDFMDGGDGFDLAVFYWQDIPTKVTLAGASVVNVLSGGIATDQLVNVEGVIGGWGDDSLIGDANANLLAGNGGSDLLDGKAGNDTLYAGNQGGAGSNDVLIGGLGIDTASWGTDPRFDYVYGLGWAAFNPIRITLNGDTASTIFIDGTASGTIQGVENLIGGDGNDTFTGDTLANRLNGGAGDDILNGGGGADTLIGGFGYDVLNGGVGIDMVDYSTTSLDASPLLPPYGIIVFLDGATDAQVLIGPSFAEFDFIRNIENVRGTTTNDAVYGDGLVNRLFGLGGNDNLAGAGGKDFLDGGAGVDSLDFYDKTLPVVLTLNGATQVTATVGGIIEDTILNMENVYGGSGNDTLTGDVKANLLYGGEGDDVLNGGGGADFLIGGFGVDTLDGGAGQDRVDYSGETAPVVVTLQGATSVAVRVDGITVDNIKNIENVRGGAGDDTLYGDGQVNVLEGGAGADILKGGLGNDVLNGGFDLSVDLFIFDAALGASNVDVVRSFTLDIDKIVLDDDVFTRFSGSVSGNALNAANFVVGPAALDSDDYLIFDDRYQVLLYDADGSGAGQAVRIATLQVSNNYSFDRYEVSELDFLVIA